VGEVILTLYTNKDITNINNDNLFVISDTISNDYKLIYEIIK